MTLFLNNVLKIGYNHIKIGTLCTKERLKWKIFFKN